MKDGITLKITKTKVEAKVRKLKEPKVTNVDELPHTEKHFDDYYDTHMVGFEQFYHRGWKSIKVLEFLNGRQWDDIALGYVHALRPSSIRVTNGCIKLDARVWRVTVYISKDNIIDYISQEVVVGLPEGVEHGDALNDALAYGIDSPQCKWHALATMGYIYTPDGAFASTDDGMVKYPEPEISSTELFDESD